MTPHDELLKQEYVRLAVYLHRRDGHNQYFARCESDICLRASMLCGVLMSDKLPMPDYGDLTVVRELRARLERERRCK